MRGAEQEMTEGRRVEKEDRWAAIEERQLIKEDAQVIGGNEQAREKTVKTSAKRRLSRELLNRADDELRPKQALAERSELLPGSTLFPSRLQQLKDTPRKLYALGNVATLGSPALAIVGARKATPYGLECAQRFGKLAARWGITVVSGGAIGCDMAAHRGALDGGGSTVVVLGSGADVVYPLRARSLFMEVLEAGGVLLSEAPWGSPPLSWAFSKRNRIIAALAEATLIVEAGLPSGTFQTADHSLALGNEVLVVPGPIFSKESKGSNRLLAQGAVPIVDDESFADALAQIFGSRCMMPFGNAWYKGNPANIKQDVQVDTTPTQNIGCQEGEATLAPDALKARILSEKILAGLQANPMTIDALAVAYRQNTVEIVRIVSQLEISGLIERLRDGRYMTKPG